LAERDLALWKQVFVGEVAENRHLSIEQVEKLADGSTLPGELALTVGLIDSIGDQDSARSWFAKNLGVGEEKVVFCE
jgi:protease-4